MVNIDNNELQAVRQRLAEMGRTQQKIEQGDAESGMRFYEEKILPLLLETFLASERDKATKAYKLLVLSLGMSWEPLVLSISCIRPEKVMILYTSETAPLLEKVMRFTGLTHRSVKAEEVLKDNVLDIYKAVKKHYHKLNCPAEVAIDYTSGTKAMSAALAMAGAYINADNVYVSSDFEGSRRKPIPGSERLTLVSNPFDVFGDLELRRGTELYSNCNYAGARDIFQRLSEHVPDPRQVTVWKQVAEAYEAWDNLNFARARHDMGRAINIIKQYSRDGRMDFLEQLPLLEQQCKQLEIMAGAFANDGQSGLGALKDSAVSIPLLFSIYHNALRRERQGKLDMASLLLYRLLEMVAQACLAARFEIDTAAPDYTKLPDDLLERYNAICNRCSFEEEQVLPDQISLLQGYIILVALDDPLGKAVDLKQIRGRGAMRNNNIFAHGFKLVDVNNYANFKALVVRALRCFVETATNLDFDQLEKEFRFVEPGKS